MKARDKKDSWFNLHVRSSVSKGFETCKHKLDTKYLVLDFQLSRGKKIFKPLVRYWKTVGVSHVHHTLEETTLFGTTVVEQDVTIFNRHDTIINSLEK